MVTRQKIRKSLKYSFIDGIFFSIMFGFGDSYFNPFAIFLKATNFQIGLLSSLPGLMSSLLQLRTPDLTEKIGRPHIINWSVFLQASMWLFIILVPFLFPLQTASWLIVGVTIYLLLGSLAAPAWGSIMAQYLPNKKRGEYFSWRQKIHGFIAIGATFAAGYILYLFPRESVSGFLIIFGVALVCRFASWYYLTRMYEPPLEQKAQPAGDCSG
jgi:hypothetical protein